jgi:hypothetical protein|tara:strand:- start:1101 stop:1358 length:258 start_codon:yes stop_codon:yes gene_type:complete
MNSSNKEILKTINFLLDNNETVFWSNQNYEVKRETNGKLIVVCTSNGFTVGLQNCEIKDCGTDKWTIREYNLKNFNCIHYTMFNY